MPQSSCSNAPANEANEDPWGRYRANLARNSGMRHHRKQCRPTTIRMQVGRLQFHRKSAPTLVFFHNVSSNPRLHPDRPVGTCNRQWRLPLINSCKKLTCNTQSDFFCPMHVHCHEKLLQTQSKNSCSKTLNSLSLFSHFFLSSFF